MTTILLLHGPNLNLLGLREPGVYGSTTMADINAWVVDLGQQHQVEVRPMQSNHEGGLKTFCMRRASGRRGWFLTLGLILILPLRYVTRFRPSIYLWLRFTSATFMPAKSFATKVCSRPSVWGRLAALAGAVIC